MADPTNGAIKDAMRVKEMYDNWFLEYASYVILERAIPDVSDGLKPVQRRILHALKQMDDGRFHKVANVIGSTMQYHPHGDAAIGDALVNLGQKDLLIDTQGNWGDVRTGDPAAAPRYIEARLSKFALDVAFNPKTTEWQLSYDGRKNEPVHLPMKFPLLLAQGAEGIAVGLATKIMPHNFIELIDASIALLKRKPVQLLPDFPTGGMADCRLYNEGKKGGKIRVRAHIEILDKKTLAVRDIPYGTTTTSVMESIVKASDQNKIKIKRVVDNTAKLVEILIELPPGVSPDVTMDALYAFTDCEVSISPNACIILDERPYFLSVHEILKLSTKSTVRLLKQELEIRRAELAEKWHFSMLEKIFIEKRIYRRIEECETWESVIREIDKGLKPYKKSKFKRKITEEDIVRLTEIKIKRISKYDSFKADEALKALQMEAKQVAHDLAHLTDYSIAYYESLLKRYGPGRERKTEIRTFDNVKVAQVAVANQKLYVNRQDGFVGYGMKKEEYVCDCSDLDDIIVFLKNGTFLVTRASEKAFVGKNIVHVDVWGKNNDRMIYHLVYFDGGSGKSYVKRFPVTAITRDKVYSLTKGADGSQVHYFSANPNGESETITTHLRPKCRAKKKVFDFDFGFLPIKGRNAQGNILTRYPVTKILQKAVGAPTLGGVDIWFDDTVGRLNTDERGSYLGNFEGEDLILLISRDGTFQLTSFDLANHYDAEKVLLIAKHDPERVVSAVHFDGQKKQHFVKRFRVEGLGSGKTCRITSKAKGSRLDFASISPAPVVEIHYLKGRSKNPLTETICLSDLIDVKGWKAAGNRLSTFQVVKVEQGPEPDGDKGEDAEALEEEDEKEQLELFDEDT